MLKRRGFKLPMSWNHVHLSPRGQCACLLLLSAAGLCDAKPGRLSAALRPLERLLDLESHLAGDQSCSCTGNKCNIDLLDQYERLFQEVVAKESGEIKVMAQQMYDEKYPHHGQKGTASRIQEYAVAEERTFPFAVCAEAFNGDSVCVCPLENNADGKKGWRAEENSEAPEDCKEFVNGLLAEKNIQKKLAFTEWAVYRAYCGFDTSEEEQRSSTIDDLSSTSILTDLPVRLSTWRITRRTKNITSNSTNI